MKWQITNESRVSYGSSCRVLCGIHCLDMAVKCHLVSPASVTLAFFSCSSRVVFLGMAYSTLLCSSKLMHSWRKEYDF